MHEQNLETDWSDEEQFRQRVHHVRRTSWKIWFVVLLCFVAVGFSLLFSSRMFDRYVSGLQKNGVHVSLVYTSWLPAFIPDNVLLAVNFYDSTGYPLFLSRDLQELGFPEGTLDDERLKQLPSVQQLRSLQVSHCEVSPEQLKEFFKRAPSLKEVSLLACPLISPESVAEFRIEFPATRFEYRGVAYLGVQGSDADLGCRIDYVASGSTADLMGIRRGDVILSVNDEETRGFQHLVEQIAVHGAGDEVLVRYSRAGQVVFEEAGKLKSRSEQKQSPEVYQLLPLRFP